MPSTAPAEMVQIRMEKEGSQRKLRVFQDLAVDVQTEVNRFRSLPKLRCDSCSLQTDCPKYRETAECAFGELFDAFPVGDEESVLGLMKQIVDENKRRWMLAVVQERTAQGGMVDPNVTRLGEAVLGQLKELIDLERDMNKVTVTVQAPAGTLAEGGRGRGILSTLFGGAPTPPEPQVIQITSVANEQKQPIEPQPKELEPPTPPSPTGSNGSEATGRGQETATHTLPDESKVVPNPRSTDSPQDGSQSEQSEQPEPTGPATLH